MKEAHQGALANLDVPSKEEDNDDAFSSLSSYYSKEDISSPPCRRHRRDPRQLTPRRVGNDPTTRPPRHHDDGEETRPARVQSRFARMWHAITRRHLFRDTAFVIRSSPAPAPVLVPARTFADLYTFVRGAPEALKTRLRIERRDMHTQRRGG